MEKIKNTCKIWEYIYTISRDRLYQKIPKEEFLRLSTSDKEYLEAVKNLNNPKISDLATEMGYTKTAVTNMVQKLEKNGYIKKIKSKGDKREINVELTYKGRYIFELKEEVYGYTIKRIKEVLTPQELETFKTILEKIAKDFDKELDKIYEQNKNIDKSDGPPII
ncbi:DNA-binding MarR family transcriptional regulator [Methanococcus maripaludis]|uniref:DNA-binding MarR family transcriptional regulator n=1 Tax=Methanococcus maripaludis TaxID=39152 RepID=A0A7J9S909_METMI|nr:MarR family transcriptional regulator [Methanococcus maripaludis]MBB6402516.1 DNA-binding MarR family transcriptional regulator [Methanococcus maripaludis]